LRLFSFYLSRKHFEQSLCCSYDDAPLFGGYLSWRELQGQVGDSGRNHLQSARGGVFPDDICGC